MTAIRVYESRSLMIEGGDLITSKNSDITVFEVSDVSNSVPSLRFLKMITKNSSLDYSKLLLKKVQAALSLSLFSAFFAPSSTSWRTRKPVLKRQIFVACFSGCFAATRTLPCSKIWGARWIECLYPKLPAFWVPGLLGKQLCIHHS